jgi:phage-related protein
LRRYTKYCIILVAAQGLSWVGSARADIRSLPPEVKHQLGYDLRLVQLGQHPRDWKPMPSVGAGVTEIRVRAGGAFRLVYVATFAEAVYVLHVFQKKSRKTSRLDLARVRARYAAVKKLRARQEGE